MNVSDPAKIHRYKPKKFDEIESDMAEEFNKYGDLISSKIIRREQRKIGGLLLI